MENTPDKFDRANQQGKNHDVQGNVENVKNPKIRNDDTGLAKGDQPTEQDKPDDTRVPTVTPDNDSGDPGPSTENSSNKGQGPSGENL